MGRKLSVSCQKEKQMTFSMIWSSTNSPVFSDGRHKQNSRNDWMLHPSNWTCDSNRKAVQWLHFFSVFHHPGRDMAWHDAADRAQEARLPLILKQTTKTPQQAPSEQRTTNSAHVGQAALRYAHFHCNRSAQDSTYTGAHTYHMHARLGL